MIIPAPSIFQERGEAPLVEAMNRKDVASAPGNGPDADNDLDFWDLLDVVNPLQHTPVVSSIYRYVTGDEIGGLARLAGGFLYGGPVGLASSAANLGIEGATGRDIGEHVLAALDGSDDATDGPGAPETALPALKVASLYDSSARGGAALGGAIDLLDMDLPA